MAFSAEEKRIFSNYCDHVGVDDGEIREMIAAYKRDPDAARVGYKALWDEVRPDRLNAMSTGISERILARC